MSTKSLPWRKRLSIALFPKLGRGQQLRWSRFLELEQLEDRRVPVVIATGVLPPIARGGAYDGVVRIQDSAAIGTGALFQTAQGQGFGHHILTAAHNITAGANSTVTFQLQRDAATAANIQITVPTGNQFQIPHPNYQAAGLRNDMAVYRLTDQVNSQPDRLLVAPYTAQQYALYNLNNEVGQNFTMVGYGGTGTGATGSTQAPDGNKRLGQNRFDANSAVLIAGYANDVVWDFDNGLAPNDAFGVLFGLNDLGLGNNEAHLGPGDSGGPAFIGTSIAAVLSAGARNAGTDINLNPMPDDSFGEYGFAARVNTLIGGFNILNAGAPAYHLVLDMNQQILGQVGPVENITITAERNGANLELIVSGSAAGNLNGTYYSAPAANIQSLTIRGGRNNETIRIIGNLGVGPITIDGRIGTNTIEIGAAGGGNLNDLAGDITIVGGTGPSNQLVVNDVGAPAARTSWLFQPFTDSPTELLFGPGPGSPKILFSGISQFTLNAGTFADTVTTFTASGTTVVNGNGGNDTIDIGGAVQGHLDYIAGEVRVYGNDGNDTLSVVDRSTESARTYTITATTVSRAGGATITYEGFESLELQGGGFGNIVNARSTTATTTTVVRSGSGNDNINVGSAEDATSTLDGIQGALTIHGENGANTLIIDDRGSPRGLQYNNDTFLRRFFRGNGPSIIYTNANPTIRTANQPPPGGGIVGNRIDAIGGAAGTQVTFIGSDGEDVINLYGPFAADSTVTFDAGLGNDLAVVAGDLVTTPQLQLASNENLDVDGGAFAPGGTTAASLFALVGDYTQTSAGILNIEIGGPAAGTDYDQIEVDGLVQLAGDLDLQTLNGFSPSSGQTFVILKNDSSYAVSGTFDGLPQGSTVLAGGVPFAISYTGGDGNDVVLIGPGSISDFVWEDANANGIQDGGEGGRSGVTVSLYPPVGPPLATVTDANGHYLFGNLIAGNYYVVFSAPSGMHFTGQDQGTNDAVDSDAGATGVTATFTLAVGQVKNDVDAGLVEGDPLLLAGSPSALHQDEVLTESALTPIAAEAALRWLRVTNDPGVQARLSAVEFRISDLAGVYLGLTAGNVIWIDKNAAGNGWYIDPTPSDDGEFVTTAGLYASEALPGTVAAERVDLLSVVIHEMGHALGFAHSDEGVMQETLALGVRHPFGCGCTACAGAVNFVEAGSPVLLSESATSAALPAVLVGGFGELFAPDPRYWEVPTSPALSSAAPIYPINDSAIADLFPLLTDDYLLADDAIADGGDDVLIGGAGDSILVGGAGRDVLIGGF